MSDDTPHPSTRAILTCDPEGEAEALYDLLKPICDERQRPLLVIIDSYLSQMTSLWVQLALRRFKHLQHEELDVLIHSPGGSLSESYRVARMLARACSSWHAIVPWQATSGATLITLGSEEIVMGDFAFLGPIDPQVFSQRSERFFDLERQSSLVAFQALAYLQQFGLEAVDTTMKFLMDEHGVMPDIALQRAMGISSNLTRPILDRIEPFALGEFSRHTILSEEYAKRISQPSNSACRSQRNANYRKLVADYPAHEFMIDREEAESLGLVVQAPSEEMERAFVSLGLKATTAEIERCIGLLEPGVSEEADGRESAEAEQGIPADEAGAGVDSRANGSVPAESSDLHQGEPVRG